MSTADAAIVASPVAATPPDAPRLSRIVVTDFRAFPKEHPGIFDLGAGCNLLAFGENGSGKSSLYRALRELFATTARDIIPFRNVFTDEPAVSVRVSRTDASEILWTSAGHPTSLVVDAARRSAFLTHTALRELIYNPEGPNEPNNIFHTAIDSVIGDFEATLDGGQRRSISELWSDVTTAFEARVTTARGVRRPQHYIRDVETACDRFNEGMRQALDVLEVQAKQILRRLLDVLAVDPLELDGLIFNPVRYREEAREAPRAIENQSLVARVKVHAYRPPAPQNFLNEGRQTALALAIYLAGRLVCAPPGRAFLKLLVMDDLLISLDASHRRPVLDLILTEFTDWQIVLLTHDRYWFQLAREQLPKADWKTVEIYERFDAKGLLCPLVRPVVDDMAQALLAQASAFLDDNHPAAACNYARSACELILRRFCIRRSVPFPYFEDERRPDLNALLTAAKAHEKDVDRRKALLDLEPHKRFVLNPFSHDPGKPIPAADVRAAIEAVQEVGRACGRAYP